MNRFKTTFMASLAALMAFASNGGNEATSPSESPIPVTNDRTFTPEIMLSLGRVGDPQVSPDGKQILFSVNYQNVEENKGNSDLWIIDIDGKKPAKTIKKLSITNNVLPTE